MLSNWLYQQKTYPRDIVDLCPDYWLVKLLKLLSESPRQIVVTIPILCYTQLVKDTRAAVKRIHQRPDAGS
jgi:hypothetical protein